jgi:hypothetical protein
MSTENKYQFKGTQGEWYPVEIAGFWEIKDEPYYEGRDLLSFDVGVLGSSVTDVEAEANARLMSSAPELLQACIRMAEYCNKHNLEQLTPEYTQMIDAIHKALNINE